MVSLGTNGSSASWTSEWRIWLLWYASFPPFSIKPLPLAMDSAATCVPIKKSEQCILKKFIVFWKCERERLIFIVPENHCLGALCQRERREGGERGRKRRERRRIKRSALTWGRQSGRDSKITRRTPIGVVTCFNSRPSASNVLLTTRPTMSELWLAICFRPSWRVWSFLSLKTSLDTKVGSSPINQNWVFLNTVIENIFICRNIHHKN